MTAPGCPHPALEAFVDVARIAESDDAPPTGYSASVRVYCSACAEPFVWIGVPMGLSPRSPHVSVDGQELRAPLRPTSSPLDFGQDGPGFQVRAS